MKIYAVMALGSILICAGCVVYGSKSEFMTNGLPKAAFDMQCPKDQIEVSELAVRSMGVRGCGKQARYEFVYGAGWVLNSGEDNKSAIARSNTTSDANAGGDAAGPSGKGKLEPEVIQRVVRRNFSKFARCYDQGLAKNATLRGKVAVRFTIQAGGNVTDASDTDQSTLHDPAVVGCIIHQFEKLTFPSPKGGVVKLIYPLVFGLDDTDDAAKPKEE